VFVAHGPEGVSQLMDQGRLYSRMSRESEQVKQELEDRQVYNELCETLDVSSSGVPVLSTVGLDSLEQEPLTDSDMDKLIAHRGPSAYYDFFHSDGNPRVSENPVIPGSHRPDTTDGDGVSKLKHPHLAVATSKVPRGNGRGETERGRAELLVSLPRIAFYEHPEQNAEERLYAELRLIYGKYQKLVESGGISFLSRRLNALVSEAKVLKESIGDEVGEDADGDGQVSPES